MPQPIRLPRPSLVIFVNVHLVGPVMIVQFQLAHLISVITRVVRAIIEVDYVIASLHQLGAIQDKHVNDLLQTMQILLFKIIT